MLNDQDTRGREALWHPTADATVRGCIAQWFQLGSDSPDLQNGSLTRARLWLAILRGKLVPTACALEAQVLFTFERLGNGIRRMPLVSVSACHDFLSKWRTVGRVNVDKLASVTCTALQFHSAMSHENV